jgi:hypothetical protein
MNHGHALTRAGSRRLPINVARVRTQIRSYGICTGQNVTGTGFLPRPYSTDCTILINHALIDAE